MALETNFQQSMTKHNGPVNQKLDSFSCSAENVDGCFDCNICLDYAHDPVVTLCGHLYCWPCIYKWLHVQSSSSDAGDQQKCPVCKAIVSTALLVPLYGRGNTVSDSETGTRRPSLGVVLPRRPEALRTLLTNTTSRASDMITNPDQHNGTVHSSNQRMPLNPFYSQAFHHQEYFSHPHRGYPPPAVTTPRSTVMPSVLSPTAGMLGEMVYAGLFGRPNASLFAYPYYHLLGSSTMVRRQEMQVDKSLSRVSLFLFCCFVLCLLLF